MWVRYNFRGFLPPFLLMLEVAGEVESMAFVQGDWLSSSSSLIKCGIDPEPEAATASCCSSV